jgi:prephenate dehydratase/chorismate mutase
MNVNVARKMIDLIDHRIMTLLGQRMELALRIGRLKKAVYEPEREQEVIGNVRSRSGIIVGPDFSESLFRKIMEESIRLQNGGLKLTGFQGEHGAYSEIAALAHDPSAVPIPLQEFRDVFEEVTSGRVDLGIVPVENSLEGAVTEVNDLLADSELNIAGEIILPIRHCLLARRGTDTQDIRIVCSHPQALAQCRGFIARHKLEARPFYDTAGASKMLSEEKPDGLAVIAGALCADLYDLEIVEENIGDHELNATRFLLLSRSESAIPGDKCSIVFSIAHEAGALSSIMAIFSGAGINLTRIESRPERDILGRYRFFLDLQGACEDQLVKDALMQVKKKATVYKFLGCYKGAHI